MSKEQGIRTVYSGPSHVVILGAGASIASGKHNPEPKGGVLPSMDNLLEVLGLTDVAELRKVDSSSRNFEAVYSALFSDDPLSPVITRIQDRVRDYFRSLALPKTPTIYDYLVLSLRPKDLIATFNWDPFLYQSFCRNSPKADMPRLAFLHGNVSVGFSVKEQRAGPAGWLSKSTGDEYIPTKMLYPITQKNYNDDEFIKREWCRLKETLKVAKLLTIFGYSAPGSDVEAMELLGDAWGDPNLRNLEQVEIIDVQPEEAMRERWDQFIYPGHYDYRTDYFESSLANYPRRTGESFMHHFLPESEDQAFQKPNPVPSKLKTIEEMWDWYRPLLEAEKTP